MSNATELLKQGRKDEIWTKYCGFFDLGIHEFMDIQKRLLMEQVHILFKSEIGRILIGNKEPSSVDEFRHIVPLTDYEIYAPYLNAKREDVLPPGVFMWAHTSGRSTADGHKWVPYTKRMYDCLGESVIGSMLLSSCSHKGDVMIELRDSLLLSTAPPPYVSGLLSYSTEEQFDIRFFPSLEEGDKMDFGDRISKGFGLAREHGLDYFYGIASVLAKIGERFESGSENFQFSPELLKPRVLTRMLKGLLIAKLNKRGLLPQDIWKIKGIMTGGTDTVIYKDKIEHYWGRKPLEGYASTESGVLAVQAWNYSGMTFYPDRDFLEFIPYEEHLKNKLDSSYTPMTLLFDELTPGIYEIVFTNFLGGVFTRYRVGDLFEVISLRDKELGIDLPQVRFYSRIGDLIDMAGIARLTESSIWQSIEATKIPYEDWVARKEEINGEVILHIYLELKGSNDISLPELTERMRTGLRENNSEFGDMEELLGPNHLKVTKIKPGSWARFMEFQKNIGADLAHTKPTHMQPMEAVMKVLLRDTVQND
ncbi:MAG: GH3 auxin-responsive promoter family protein [Anaerolineaceae bacterium]|nr:GH3 auxin-responsive promoter family protein [Anaerolineaceae bacterium]